MRTIGACASRPEAKSLAWLLFRHHCCLLALALALTLALALCATLALYVINRVRDRKLRIRQVSQNDVTK
jgi:hypothetical protein